MTIYKDSYNTTVGSMYAVKSLEHHIKECLIQDGLLSTLSVREVGEYRPGFITGRRHSEDQIPLFTHPIVIDFNKHLYLCTDLRLSVNKDKVAELDWGSLINVEDIASNLTEYNFAKSRAILNLLWVGGSPNDLKSGLSFAATIYAYWISELISKMYALDGGDSLVVTITASYYYQSLFIDGEIDEDTKYKMATHTIKTTKLPAEEVLRVYDLLTTTGSVNDFCKMVRHAVGNVRLDTLDAGGLMTLARNSWYGTNAKEIISVALEHPPTWIAVVYAALTNKSYKSSTIYRVADRWGKRGVDEEFIKTFKSIITEEVGYQPTLSPATEALVFKDF